MDDRCRWWGPKTDDGAVVTRQAEPLAPPSLLRRVGRTTLWLAGLAVLLLSLGFAAFVWRLPDEEIKLTRKADGIVALAGGSSRVADAMELLAAERGRRLLISGANRATTLAEISRFNPDYARVVRCCVDFDRSLNTLGNAVETGRWAQAQGFRSLIVVTSNYHMPRALAEIAHQLPDVTLIPFPVVSDQLRTQPWWNAATARLLISEYLKYIFAHVRMLVNPRAE